MKNIYSIFILPIAVGITISGSVHAKNMHKVFGTDYTTIKNSCKVELYIVDAIPVMSVEQVQGQNYIYDYRIIKAKTVKKKDGSSVFSAVLDTNQYVYGEAKKCPFMAKYAVHFRKGNKSVTIVISIQPCDKAIIFCPGSIIDKRHIDLVDHSSIISAIDKLMNPTGIVEGKK